MIGRGIYPSASYQTDRSTRNRHISLCLCITTFSHPNMCILSYTLSFFYPEHMVPPSISTFDELSLPLPMQAPTFRISCNHSAMNLNLSSYRWVSRGMSITASNSGTTPRACIHRSAFYHDFTGSIPCQKHFLFRFRHHPLLFCSYSSSANPYFFYTFSYRSTDGSSPRIGIRHFCNYSSPLDVNDSCILSSISSNCCTTSCLPLYY